MLENIGVRIEQEDQQFRLSLKALKRSVTKLNSLIESIENGNVCKLEATTSDVNDIVRHHNNLKYASAKLEELKWVKEQIK